MDSEQRAPRRHSVIVPAQMLRGVAASLVVSEHFVERLVRRGVFPAGLPNWTSGLGIVGVTTFFVISGFIMIYTTTDEFGREGAAPRFFMRRIKRIVPLYWITSCSMIIFDYLMSPYSTTGPYTIPTLKMIAMSAFFIPYMGSSHIIQPVYGLGWTLEYEMFFYLIFSAALNLPRRLGQITLALFMVALFALGTQLLPAADSVGQTAIAYYFTRPIILYFVAGMLIAGLRNARGVWCAPFPDWLIGTAAAALLIMAVRWGATRPELVRPTLVVGAVALATLAAGGVKQSDALTKLAARFGDVSYSIYLTHSFLLGAMALLIAPHLRAAGPLTIVLTTLAVCLGCAVAAWPAWRLIERNATFSRRHRDAALEQQPDLELKTPSTYGLL